MTMVTVIYHPFKSYMKIVEQIKTLMKQYESEGYEFTSSTVLHVGTVPDPSPTLRDAARIVMYIDLPYIEPFRMRTILNRYRHKTVLIVNSRYTAVLMEKHVGVTVDMVVHHGIDPAIYHPYDTAKTVDVLCITSLVPRKGVDKLLQVADKCRQLRFRILIDKMINASDNVDVLPHRNKLSENDVAALYNMSRVHLCTSLHECFHIPTIEAAACGTVPVVPSVPPFNEHSIPHKYMYPAEVDVDRLVPHRDGLYPEYQYDTSDIALVLNVAVRHVVTWEEVKHVLDRYDYRRLYRPIIEHLLKR